MTKFCLPPRTISRAAAFALCLLPSLVLGEPVTDLHDIAVGMSASQLPAEGYRDFNCAGRSIAGWNDWSSCPVGGADGLRAMRVAYNQPGEETKVGGHPVDLTVFFDDLGHLAKIEIKTDDHAPLYFYKKAYMLAKQTKTHYGEDLWICNDMPTSNDEEPLGSIYINQTCTKLTAERRIDVSNRLFRKKGQSPRDFVSETKVSVAMAPPSRK